MTSGDSLKDLIVLARHVQWQYKLENFTVESLKFITEALENSRNELFNEISRRDIRLPKSRPDKVLKELNDMTFGIQAQLTGNIIEATEVAGRTSFDEYGRILSFDGRLADTIGFNFVSLSPEQLKAMVVDVPVGGKVLKDWVSDNFKHQIVDEIKTDIATGLFKGESTAKLVNRLHDSFNMLNHEAITLTRTYVGSINNRAAEAVYKANSDIVKKEEWSATLEVSTKSGAGTCFQCVALDGRQWPIGTDHPRPLAHPRCRCFMLPVTASYKELGLNIDELEDKARPFTVRNGIPVDTGRSGKTVLDFGMFKGQAQDFVKKKGPIYFKNTVGPRRKELIDAGKITFNDLVDKNGKVVLLKDLPKLDPPPKKYRRPSPKIPESLKKSLLEAESKIYLRKTEKAYVFTPDGKKVFSKPGGKSSVSFTQKEADKMKGNILTHNHPYGSSFSLPDIELFVLKELEEIRAVGQYHRYSFSVNQGMPEKEMAIKEIRDLHKKYDKKMYQYFSKKIDQGKLTPEYAQKEHAHRVWSGISHDLNWIEYRRLQWPNTK